MTVARPLALWHVNRPLSVRGGILSKRVHLALRLAETLERHARCAVTASEVDDSLQHFLAVSETVLSTSRCQRTYHPNHQPQGG